MQIIPAFKLRSTSVTLPFTRQVYYGALIHLRSQTTGRLLTAPANESDLPYMATAPINEGGWRFRERHEAEAGTPSRPRRSEATCTHRSRTSDIPAVPPPTGVGDDWSGPLHSPPEIPFNVSSPTCMRVYM
jgi:hypothetical protein